MYKNILFLILLISSIIIVFLILFTKNIYAEGEKYIDGDGKIFLIFDDNFFSKRITLIEKNKEINFYIKNIYQINNLNIYEMHNNINLLQIEKIIAIVDKMSLLNFIFYQF